MNYFSINEEFRKSLYKSSFFQFRKKEKFSFLFMVSLLIIFFLGIFIDWNKSFIFSKKEKIESISQNFFSGSFKREKLTISNSEKLETGSVFHQKEVSLKRDETKRINFLLLGFPGEPWPAPYLTDSIEVISIDEDFKKILVIGIPRDLLVKIPDSGFETRINALYALSNDPKIIREKIKEITGLEIQYWLILDLSFFKKIIDSLNGIEIEVKEDILDKKFPTINRGYETFFIEKGKQIIDGEKTIKYIRSRRTKGGDFDRINRQQQVMEAILEKIKKLNLLLDFPKILSIFEEIKNKTNVNLEEIPLLIEIGKNFSNNENKIKIEYFSLDAGKPDSLLVFGETLIGKNLASVIWPKKGKFDYEEIRETIKKRIETGEEI